MKCSINSVYHCTHVKSLIKSNCNKNKQAILWKYQNSGEACRGGEFIVKGGSLTWDLMSEELAGRLGLLLVAVGLRAGTFNVFEFHFPCL